MVDDMSDVIKQPLDGSIQDAWLRWHSLASLDRSINIGFENFLHFFTMVNVNVSQS